MSSVWWIPCRNSGIHHHIPGHRPIVQSSSLLICDSHIDENFATTFHYSVENFSTIWNLLIQIFTWAVAQSLRCSDVLCGHHRQVSAWSLLSCPLSLNSSIMSLRASYWDSTIFLTECVHYKLWKRFWNRNWMSIRLSILQNHSDLSIYEI